MKRPVTLWFGLGMVAICAAAQVRINYHDQDFTLSGFDKFSATLEDKGITFNGSGNPLNIGIESSGTTITGSNAEGNAQRGDTGAYFLQNATVNGNAHLTMNGAAAQKYASEHGNKSQQTETTSTDIISDTLKYAGTANDGRVDFPGAVTIDSTSTGQAGTRQIHLTGSSGFVTMSLNTAGNNALQTGQVNGPVAYSGQGQSKTKDGQTQTTTYDGKSDNLSFDFTKEPRTLTMSGHVTLNAKGTGATGDIAADTVVVTLDANLKPTKIDITGSPAKTTMHQEPPR